jgi:hypothetical protein
LPSGGDVLDGSAQFVERAHLDSVVSGQEVGGQLSAQGRHDGEDLTVIRCRRTDGLPQELGCSAAEGTGNRGHERR